MKRLLTILMHTHWDREWYFTKNETQVWLVNHMSNLFKFLETTPHAIYILDGQSVMIDDLLEIAPHHKDKLNHFINNGQLRIGPWYTQTDLLIVSGESVIRNLFYGIKSCLPYGKPMLVGYAPDTFGHSAQMPQIYKQFGIESSFFWRGHSQLKAKKSDFVWQGIDGSNIIGINLATGYQGAKYLENTKTALKERMVKILSVLDKYSTSNNRLIMNGHDQMPVQEDIDNVISMLKELYPNDDVVISDFESYIASLDKTQLELVSGELSDSKHARIHKTITSTRQDIKQLNHDLESAIVNELEPLAILAHKIGLDYPHTLIEKCYKELFGVHAHDSIGGCNSDAVNHEIKMRLLNVKEWIFTQIELFKRLISMASGSYQDGILTVFNYYPIKRYNEVVEFEIFTHSNNFSIYNKDKELNFRLLSQEKVDAGLIDRQIAARLKDIWIYKSIVRLEVSEIAGLSVLYLKVQECEPTILNKAKLDNYIENSKYKLFIKNNLINIENKASSQVYKNIIYIENSGDVGDSYDYSPPINDLIINSSTIEVLEQTTGIFESELKLKVRYLLPQNAVERESKKLTTTVDFYITFIINHKHNQISLSINSTNILSDSRFRLVFNPAIVTDTVFSDSHLCEIKRPVYNKKPLDIWQEDGWVEKPVSIETFQSYVYLKNEKSLASIISNGIKEYEVVNGKIYLTMWRSFSHLGKRELVNRPGRPSGIEIATPDNQLLNVNFISDFYFSLEDCQSNLAIQSKLCHTPLKAYQLKEFNRFNLNAPPQLGQIEHKLNLDLNGACVSSIKFNEQNQLFMRLFNPTNHMITINHSNLYHSNMMEEKLDKCDKLTLTSQEIINIILI